MSRTLLSLGCCLALMGGAFAEIDRDATDKDLNEGARLFKNGPHQYTFHWWERAGSTYFLQTSVDLVDWSYIPDNILTGNNTADEITLTLPANDRLFVRVVRWPVSVPDPNGADFDFDHVSNFNELRAGTDPLPTYRGRPFPDEDGDGMSDDWEFRFGLNPDSAADRDLDLDGDGKSNLQEFNDGPFGTDATDPYNGMGYPIIVSIGWPSPPPTDEPGTLLAQPFVVEVKNGATPVNGARVTFYTQGPDAGQISLSSDGVAPATILHRLTDSTGHAQVYFRHPPENPPVPTQRTITAKVGSAVPTGNGPVASVFATTQFNYSYPPNTVGRSASEAIDSRIAGKDAASALPIFSIQHVGPPFTPDVLYERNTASWCYDLRQQMTCISPYYIDRGNGTIQYGFTAITPQHVITSGHVDVTSLLNVGDTVRFVTADGVVITPERKIVGKVRHPNYVPYYPDFTICTLDSPLPATITPCKMLPANYANYLGYLENGRPPVMVLNQYEKALVTELRELGPSVPSYAEFVRPALHRKRLDFYENVIFGDSGNPAFLIIKPPNTGLDTLVLLTTLTHDGAGGGTFTTPLISDLNAMIAAADADATARNPLLPPFNTGLQVQTIDLSGFSTFTSP